MNIIIPKFGMNGLKRNALWAAVRQSWIGKFVNHEGQLSLARDIGHQFKGVCRRDEFAERLFGMQLRGAGYGWESRRNLQPASDAAIATTGANTVNFNIYDWFEIAVVGFVWTVAGTVTAMVMDFDLYPRIAAGGTVVDKLDGTNGVLSGAAFTVASQAIGNLWYNDIADTKSPVTATPGNSVQAIVTTTTTAGNGIPLVIGWPKAETFRNLSTAVRMTGP